ncbi:protein translocase subunit SecF [Candidatus Woesearchaeota archaeon]|nr:protein translocase subunit SecF [Candidatus Woesearchaeota archaeon]
MGLSRRERREQRRKLLKEKRIGQLRAFEQHDNAYESRKQHKGFLKIYDRHYKKFLIITITLLVLALASIGYKWATTGDFMNRGVSLKGGIVMTFPVEQPVSIDEIKILLKTRFPGDDLEVRSIEEFGVQKAVMVSTDNIQSEKEVIAALEEKIPGAKENASTETTGESLGGGFFKQTMIAILISFIFMAVVVLFSFRTFIPSMAVVLCAFANIVEALAVVNLLELKISTAGIASFLMLIGYSVDTDILLTSRVLKSKEGSVFDRILSAAKTGILMTITAIIAVTIALIFTSSETIKEIMIIMLIGLSFDLINTWLQNAAILRSYAEGRKAKPAPAITDDEMIEELDEEIGQQEAEEKEQELEELKQDSVQAGEGSEK